MDEEQPSIQHCSSIAQATTQHTCGIAQVTVNGRKCCLTMLTHVVQGCAAAGAVCWTDCRTPRRPEEADKCLIAILSSSKRNNATSSVCYQSVRLIDQKSILASATSRRMRIPRNIYVRHCCSEVNRVETTVELKRLLRGCYWLRGGVCAETTVIQLPLMLKVQHLSHPKGALHCTRSPTSVQQLSPC